MTIQTNLLEWRLSQLHTKAQQLLAHTLVPQGSLLDDGRAWFDKPEVVAFWAALDGLDTELRRVLRQFDALERAHADMQATLRAVPHDGRWRELARIKSFEDDLARATRSAAKLAALLIELRRRGGVVSNDDLAQAIHTLGTEVGKSLDQMMVRRTVQHVSTRPIAAPPQAPGTDFAGTIDVLFVVISMVSLLARRRRGGKS